jgi:methylenetetrahydrofolate--tRNA-(uracil-5-)-methyltransferase
MIPGLENATFLRYGVMHRNTYLRSPGFLADTYATLTRPDLFFAGQMTGVEGYIESAGSGLVAGINAARAVREMPALHFPRHTMLGAMAAYVANGGIGDFLPMNANFGIVDRLDHKVRGGKAARNEALSARALEALDGVIGEAKA